jgi:hypothetical protein
MGGSRFCNANNADWSGWDGVGTAAVTLVGPIAYFTRMYEPDFEYLANCDKGEFSYFNYISFRRLKWHAV